MTPLQIAAFRAHTESSTFRRKLAALDAFMDTVCPATSYVSFSAGKDSSVIAHACHERHPGIAMLMVDPGVPTHWTLRERTNWLDYATVNGWNLTVFPWNKWGTRRDEETTEEYQARVHADMFRDLHAYAERSGLTCRIMGLRAAESRARRYSIGRRGAVYSYAGGGSAMLPISTWQTDDVWAYIVTNNLPWLEIYDAIGPQARNGLVGRSGEEFGRHELLRRHYPEVWRWAVSKGIL